MSMVAQPFAREPVEPHRARFRRDDIEAARKAQDGLCARCKRPLEAFEADHVLPVELGGKTTLANLQLLCPTPCHKIKSAEDIKAIRKAQRLARDSNPETRRKSPHRLQSRGFQGKDPLRA